MEGKKSTNFKIMNVRGKDYLLLTTSSCVSRIDIGSILSVSQHTHKVDLVYLADGSGATETKSFNGKTAEVADALMEHGEGFHLCHSYCMVNFDHVTNIDNNCIKFDNGQMVCMGVNQLRRSRRAYSEYEVKR